jgi:predicted nucleic acid-binding protein|tara:strand:+ start:1071 stop:1472 length:402 start_codon:yes stop_codon:yes gene_type:complete
VTLYIDSSAVLKRYFEEEDSTEAIDMMGTDPVMVISPLVEVEVHRNLALHLDGERLEEARYRFTLELDGFAIVPLDAQVCAEAARIAEQTLCRSLDAIHLAAARRAGPATTVLTFDQRRAQAARSIGLSAIGC